MTNLSDREIAEAAAEVGISPAELRGAMAERSGNLPARISEERGMITATRGAAVQDFVETQFDAPPPAALAHMRRFLEQESRHKGHKQGEDQVDIYDETRGIAYRLRAESDGAQGSIVRVDIDPSAAKAKPTYMALGGGSVALLGTFLGSTLAGLGLGTALAAGAAMLMGTLAIVGWQRRGVRNTIQEARETVQAALTHANTHDIKSLAPPRSS